MLRAAKVVGKFVEFHGEGAASLPADRPRDDRQHGARVRRDDGLLPRGRRDLQLPDRDGPLGRAGRDLPELLSGAGHVRHPRGGECEYSRVLELDLSEVRPSVAGPKRPQDRIALPELKAKFLELFEQARCGERLRQEQREPALPFCDRHGRRPAGRGRRRRRRTGDRADHACSGPRREDTNPWTETEMVNNRPTPDRVPDVTGAIARHSIDSGPRRRADRGDHLVHKHLQPERHARRRAAGEEGGRAGAVRPAEGEDVAGARLARRDRVPEKTGLQPYLDQLGFNLVGYGCTTCIGNSGPLDPRIEEVVTGNDSIAASVLSGNRNFEARVHQNIKANFLMSPPLVVAFALAGRVDIDMTVEPLGHGREGRDVYLRDIWPTLAEIGDAMQASTDPGDLSPALLGLRRPEPALERDPGSPADVYDWDPEFDLHPGAAVLRGLLDDAGASRRHPRRAAAGDLRRLSHDRSHQPGRSDQGDFARRASTCRNGRRVPRTSTATARGAATTAS